MLVAPPNSPPYSNLYPNKPTILFGILKSELERYKLLLPFTDLALVQLPEAIEPALMKSVALEVVHANDPQTPFL